MRFGHVEGIETGDIGLIGCRDGFLGLDNLQVVGDSRFETILRLGQGLVGKDRCYFATATKIGRGFSN